MGGGGEPGIRITNTHTKKKTVLFESMAPWRDGEIISLSWGASNPVIGSHLKRCIHPVHIHLTCHQESAGGVMTEKVKKEEEEEEEANFGIIERKE